MTDLSGIGGAYVKFDAAPATGTDGVFYSGSTQINEVRAPSEGRHSVYVWLRDGAGNADFRAAVAISDSVWYDGTPPTSLITPSAASGLNGWYIEPVTFDISATDAASGLLEVDYQVDEGTVHSANATAFPPDTQTTDSSFVFSQEGRHTVRIWAVDRAGNVEPAHVFDVAIDKTPPSASFSGPAGIVTNTQFDVSWSGADYGAGSGLATYDVQVRDGYVGAWQNWLTRTTLTAAQYQAERGHVYYFRVFGRDRAGNRQATPGAWKVLVQPVLNGGFDTGNFSDWTVGGLLYSSVVATTGPGNASTLAAKLGSEVYGPSLTPPGNVPGGCATITQTITIPSLEQMREPRLRFSHRVQTYDVMYSANLGAYVDTLDVNLTDEQGQQIALLLRTGNPTSVWGSLYDTGWQLADLDLKEYAGRTLQLSFANCNGPQAPKSPDNMLNTWSYVDGIQIYDRNPMYLPVITQAAPAGEAAGSPDPATAEETTVPGTPVEAEPVR